MNRHLPRACPTRRVRRPAPVARALAGVVLALAGINAGSDADPFGSGRALFMLDLVEVSGNHQTLPTGGAQSAPLVVRVLDQNGSPHRGITIEWTLSKGTGTLSATSSTSDANGLVQVTYSSRDEPGETMVTASFNPVSSGSTASRPVDPVAFTITVE